MLTEIELRIRDVQPEEKAISLWCDPAASVLFGSISSLYIFEFLDVMSRQPPPRDPKYLKDQEGTV